MDTSSSKSIKWQYKTLPWETKNALDFLSKEKWLENSSWYLAGGTALALQVSHRKSYDLDFFTPEKEFNTKELLTNFINNKNWVTTAEERSTIFGELFKAKISFIAYPFFVPKQEPLFHGYIKVIAATDIAVMKITAISQRGRKRDFFDLYWCANNIDSLENIIKRLPEQYPFVTQNLNHILNSLVYFKDAEEDSDPEIYFDVNWKMVKEFFKKEVPLVLKKLIDLK